MADELDILLDKDIALMMKASLEYNAAIVALATAFYGNMDSRRAQRQLRDNLERINKEYTNQLNLIINGYEKDTQV